MSSKPYTFDRVVRLVISAITLIAIMLLVRRLSAVLLPFVVGWLLAYLLNPLVNFIQHKMRITFRVPSIILALVFIIAATVGVVELLVPAVRAEAANMGALSANFVNTLGANRLLTSETYDWIVSFVSSIDWEQWISDSQNQEVVKDILPHFWNVISSTMQIIIGIFALAIIILYMIFILIDFENLSDGFISYLPEKYRRFVSRLLKDVSSCTNHYFRGQALVAFIVGALFAVGFKIMGLPMGITIGLVIGVLNLVPYMQTLGLVPVLLLVMLQATSPETNHWLCQLGVTDPWQSFWILLAMAFAVFLIVQSTQDLVLVPKIMGKAMGLNPAVILLSLSVWGALLGVIGMIIALPVTTLLISYYKRYVLHDFSADLFGRKEEPEVVAVAAAETPTVENQPEAAVEPQPNDTSKAPQDVE
ncbi:MAG: AI-2E family transporter [Paludibacteraceae bacterium]|nr:AI-2E family transporter [Paludibacteraceae bacterium]